MNETTPQVRANACASYLFLAPFFLLARGNPDLAHPFVRSHARYALALQLLIAASYGLFGYWGALESVFFPGVPFSLGFVLETALFLVATLGIFVGVLSAARGRQPAFLARAGSVATAAAGARLQEASGLDESAKARVMASYVPFLGLFAAVSEPHPAAQVGARVSSWYACIAMVLALFWRADASASALTLAYVLLVSFVAVQLFVFNRTWRWGVVENLPDAQRAGLLLRTAADWFFCALRAAFGRRRAFSWKALLAERADLESAKDALYAKRFDNPSFPGAPWMAFFPVVNLGIALAVRGTRSKWIPALGQGVALTCLGVVLWFFAPFLFPFLAFPFALGMAHAATDPSYKVPVAFELSAVARRAWDRAERAAKATVQTGRKTESVSLPVDAPRA